MAAIKAGQACHPVGSGQRRQWPGNRELRVIEAHPASAHGPIPQESAGWWSCPASVWHHAITQRPGTRGGGSSPQPPRDRAAARLSAWPVPCASGTSFGDGHGQREKGRDWRSASTSLWIDVPVEAGSDNTWNALHIAMPRRIIEIFNH